MLSAIGDPFASGPARLPTPRRGLCHLAGTAAKGSGGPQDAADQPRAGGRPRAPRPADLRGALARGGPCVLVPGPLRGGGLDEYWMHDTLLGLLPCWPQLRRRLA